MDTLGSADMMRQMALVVVLVICVAIAIFILIWSQEPDYRPLAKMETQELIETLDYMDANQIDYKLEGNIVYVRSDEFQNIRLGMTRQGLTKASDAGTDIIMQDMGFGVSQRVEMERLKHAREQQIAATIEDIASIQKARVLLAMPKENVFARREKKASATVVLTAKRGAVIAGEEVDAVVDIVASAVQNMEPSKVTVTDSNGRLLNSGSQDSMSARARKEYEIERQREQEYLEKIDAILIPVLGIGNYTAQADVTMDFTAMEQTQRSYNPDLPAVRSEMIMEENSVGGGVGGIPGAGATIRTVVNIQSGGKTKLSGMIAAITLLITLLILSPIASQIPAAVLAGILVTVGIGVMDYKGLSIIMKIPKTEIIVMLVVLVLSVFWNLVFAVGIGLVIASLFFMKKMADISKKELRLVNLNIENLWEDEKNLSQSFKEKVFIKHLSGPLFFGFTADFVNISNQIPQSAKILIIRMDEVPYVDQSGLFALEDVLIDLSKKNTEVYIVGLKAQPKYLMNIVGIFQELIPKERLFQNFEDCKNFIVESQSIEV